MGPSPLYLPLVQFYHANQKAKSNQTHTDTPATMYCTMYSVEVQSEEAEGLPDTLFF